MLVRPLLAIACTLALAAVAHATPIITTSAQATPGASDSDGPQTGGALSSSVTTAGGAKRCSFVGSCAFTDADAIASQNETVFGILSALQADGVFFSGGSAITTLSARTTWQDSPAVSGPTSITLFIKPGELTLIDFASIVFGSATTARYRIELSVNGNVLFFSEALLSGGPGGLTLTESGTDLGGTLVVDPNYIDSIRGYTFDALLTTIDLGVLSTSDVVRYTMEVSASGPGFETGAFARVGDPFDLTGNGSSIAFGSVPEPSVALLLGAGLLGLAVLGRRRPAPATRGSCRTAWLALLALSAPSGASATVVYVGAGGSIVAQDPLFATATGAGTSGSADIVAGAFAARADSAGFTTHFSEAGLLFNLVLTNNTGSTITLSPGALSAHVVGSFLLDQCAGCGITNNNRSVVRGQGSLSTRVANPGRIALDSLALGTYELSRFWNGTGGVTSESSVFTPLSQGGGSVLPTSATFTELIFDLMSPSIVLDPNGTLSLQFQVTADSIGGNATFSSLSGQLALSLPTGVTLTNDTGVPLDWITVPEPSVALLLGAGLLALVALGRSRAP